MKPADRKKYIELLLYASEPLSHLAISKILNQINPATTVMYIKTYEETCRKQSEVEVEVDLSTASHTPTHPSIGICPYDVSSEKLEEQTGSKYSPRIDNIDKARSEPG